MIKVFSSSKYLQRKSRKYHDDIKN
jgi:hypothetical protein